MKVLKIILYVLLGLIGLFLLLGLIAPREVTTSRSVVIEAPKEAVFNTVNNLETWESWSPWKEMDPAMKVSMGDPTMGKGAFYTWEGETSGSGKMAITESTPPDSLAIKVEFEGMGEADGDWSFEEMEGGTKTTWGFHTDFPYPWNAMLLFQDFEGAIHKDYDRGLELLKENVEAKVANTTYNGYEVKKVALPARHFITRRKTIPMDKMAEFYTQHLGGIFKAVQDNNIEMNGMPCGLYYTWDEEKQETDMAAAIPVKEETAVEGYDFITLPEGEALLVDYYGDYEGLGDAHMAIDEYLKASGEKAGAPVIEQYVTDPAEEPDTLKWLTKVYYPLAKN